jgi:hypothetical protein
MPQRVTRCLSLCLLIGVASAIPGRAQTFTVCSDFACGTFNSFQPGQPVYRPHPIWHPAGRQQSTSAWAEYVRQHREKQREKAAAEERVREQEEQVRRQIAWAQHLQQVARVQMLMSQLQQMEAQNAAESEENERLLEKIAEALPEFEGKRARAERDHAELLEGLEYSIDHIQVPSPPGRYIPRMLFLGLTATPDEALHMQREGARDPFDGVPYNGVYAFGYSSGFLSDSPRVIDDHLLLQAGLPTASETMLSPVVRSLEGATIGELVCHSNGCAIAESLIREGIIHVKTLRMLGGDGMLMHLNELSILGKEKNMQITAYATVRDPVPLLPQGWDIREWADEWQGAPRRWILSGAEASNATYQVLGLASGSGGPAAVKVELLSAPGGMWPTPGDVLRDHRYSTYYGLIEARRLLAASRGSQ